MMKIFINGFPYPKIKINTPRITSSKTNKIKSGIKNNESKTAPPLARVPKIELLSKTRHVNKNSIIIQSS